MINKGKHYNIGKDNPRFGKTHTPEAIEKMRQSKLGSNNPNYKKDFSGSNGPNWNEDDLKISYYQLHRWIRKQIPKPEKCEVCNIKSSTLDLANVTGVYNRDFTNWQYQCRKCHMLIDGRLSSIHHEKDMNNRVCLLCGITQKERTESYAREWCEYKNGHICKKCYRNKIRYPLEKQGVMK